MRPKKTKNLEMLAAVAKGLRHLKEKVVFVGGATIDLYLSDPAAPEARATDDVDCVVELAKRTEYHGIEEELRKLGFKHPMGEKAPVCRWRFQGIQVDVMPTEGRVLGFNNRWYAEGVARAQIATLADDQEVSVFTVPYLLASKIDAFKDRGKGDFFASPDLEDVLAVIDGCPEARDLIGKAPAKVRAFLAETFREFLSDRRFVEAVHGHVRAVQGGEDHAERVLKILRQIGDAG